MFARRLIPRVRSVSFASGLAAGSLSFARRQRFSDIPSSRDPSRSDAEQDKLLFTPGPLTTSYTVKKAATRDLGSRDIAFINVIERVCSELLNIAGVSNSKYCTVPVQGSGTFAVEGVLSTVVPRNKKVLILANGAYGLRMGQICKAQGIEHTLVEWDDDTQPPAADVDALLAKDGGEHSHVAMVHSETTSGIINDLESVGEVVAKHGRTFFVDAMSSFGAADIDMEKAQIAFLVSSANKCIEGIPGFSFAIARTADLEASKGNARTLSLDLQAQRAGLDANKQFRFTPPTHSILAFDQAITELMQEGGVQARAQRYQENQRVLQAGMEPLGFDLYLPAHLQGHIISSYRYPTDPNWNFETFYSKLNERDFVIYPGKVSNADCFRIGHIGRIFPDDTRALLKAIEEVCKEMKTGAFYNN